MHVGHCRGAVVGDALANLLAKAGYDVTKEYYINDAGAQVTALAWAAYWRYLQAIGTAMTEEEFSDAVPGGLQYRGDYLVPVGEALAQAHGAALAMPDRDDRRARGLARHRARLHHRRDDGATSARTSQRSASRRTCLPRNARWSRRGAADAIDRRNCARDGLIYEGVLEPPKGKTPGRLGTAAADPVPRHPIRRRRRPAAAQIRRQQHLFRQRHRLSRRQDRRAASTC